MRFDGALTLGNHGLSGLGTHTKRRILSLQYSELGSVMNQPALLALLAGVVRAVLGSQAREVLSNFVEAIMSYLYSVLAQVGDKEAFSEASQSWVGGEP